MYKTRKLLSVELGPGIMGSIYDGVQRPLGDIRGGEDYTYMSALDHDVNWDYNCLSSVRIGSHIRGGDMFGIVRENTLFEHKIMMPPNGKGTVVFKAYPGNYCVDVSIMYFKLYYSETKYVLFYFTGYSIGNRI